MSEIIKERVKGSIGKEVKVFLLNGFRYAGKLTNCDEDRFELLDYKSQAYKLILFCDVKDLEVSVE